MNWDHFYSIWPAAQKYFGNAFLAKRLPSQKEVAQKVDDLRLIGDEISAQRIEAWWSSIPANMKINEVKAERLGLHFEPSKPRPKSEEVASTQLREEEIFTKLGAAPKPDLMEREVSGSFKNWLIPMGVIVLVVVLFGSASLINGVRSIGDFFNRLENGQIEVPSSGSVDSFHEDYPVVASEAKEIAPMYYSSFFGKVYGYKIKSDLTLYPSPTEAATIAWERAKAIFGDDLSRLRTFEVSYDGADTGIAAYVDLDAGALVLALDGPMANSEVQQFTLIHEYNHLLTLYEDPSYRESGVCPTVLILGGTACISSESPLYAWTKEFWDEPGMLDGVSTGDMEAGELREKTYPGEFVNAYAASAPQEDMAETFAAWVMDKPIPAEKKAFFESSKENIELKKRIRATLERG